MFSNRDGGPLDITNLRERVWRPALRRAKLRARTLYQTRHTFATLMVELGESPGWVATRLGHTDAEMVYRRYHRFIPNLRGRDGALAAKGSRTRDCDGSRGHWMVTRRSQGVTGLPVTP